MINILPYKHKRAVNYVKIMRAIGTAIWATVLLVGVAMLLLVPLLVSINSRFAIAEKQIAKLESDGVVTNPIDVAALQERSVTLFRKLANPLAPTPTEYIKTIRSSAGAGISLSGFSMSINKAPTVEVSGVASSRVALQSFIDSLQKNESVESVDSPVSNFVKSTNSPFNITIIFKCHEEAC